MGPSGRLQDRRYHCRFRFKARRPRHLNCALELSFCEVSRAVEALHALSIVGHDSRQKSVEECAPTGSPPPTPLGEGDLKLLDVDLRLSFVIKMTRVERQRVDDSLEGFESALQEHPNVSGGNIASLSCPRIFQELAVFR